VRYRLTALIYVCLQTFWELLLYTLKVDVTQLTHLSSTFLTLKKLGTWLCSDTYWVDGSENVPHFSRGYTEPTWRVVTRIIRVWPRILTGREVLNQLYQHIEASRVRWRGWFVNDMLSCGNIILHLPWKSSARSPTHCIASRLALWEIAPSLWSY
jgi:hypothetical protein